MSRGGAAGCHVWPRGSVTDSEQWIGSRSGWWKAGAVGIASAVAAVALVLAAPSPARAAGGIGGAPTADTNGDRVFDDLAAQLAPLSGAARVNVIVRLDGPAVDARVGSLQALVGPFSVGRVLTLIDGFSATVTKAQVELLRSAPGVVSIEENGLVSVENVPGNADFGVTKARTDVPALDGEADGAPTTYSKDDLVAAVIDTGIDATHHDLDGGKVLAFVDCMAPVYATCTPTTAYDDHGHGTHVAATIAGTGTGTGEPGVAPRAALVGIKVLDSSGSGTDATVIAGITWAVANRATYGIRVINLSLGALGCSDGTDAISSAVNAAAAAGIVVVVAAGNSGPAACTVGSPGAAAAAITVGAMADTSAYGFALAEFSSRGPTLATPGNPARVKPDISAPGYGVVSAKACASVSPGPCTHDESSVKSGTSMATPFVAGVALLMLDANPSLTPAQVKSKLMTTAVDWGAVGIDNEYGAGRLDAYAALASAGAALTSPPSVQGHAAWSGSLAAGGQVEIPLNVTSTAFPVGTTDIFTSFQAGASGSVSVVPPSGTTLTSSGGNRQETVRRSALVTGTWLVRVSSTVGALDYQLDVAGGLGSGAPANSVAPAVTGTVGAGQTLTASYGTWTGASPASWGFQWQRCDAAGASCAAISGATSRAYAVSVTDIGSTLRSALSFTNAAGSATAIAAATATVLAAVPPTNTGLPAVSGTVQDGQTLSATDGTWSGTRTSTTRQWQRCDLAGASCSAIAGAAGTTLALHAIDIGSTIRFEATATNTGSSTVVTSAATAAVAAISLAVTALPSVSGTAQVGQTLTGVAGTWTGTSPIFSYQWQRCDSVGAGCSAIAGAVALAYALDGADIGSTLRFSVAGTNVVAVTPLISMSAPTSVVAAAASPAPAPASIPAPVVSGGPSGGGGGGGGP